MKTLFGLFLLAGALAQADPSFSSLIDPAQDAFCTDPAHPICLKLTNITFTGVPELPTDVTITDENGGATVYAYSNIIVNVDPGGLTYSGSVTPDEAFSITAAQNIDLENGLFYLGVYSDADGPYTLLGGTTFSAADAAATPEPGSAGLLLAGVFTGCLIGRRRIFQRMVPKLRRIDTV